MFYCPLGFLGCPHVETFCANALIHIGYRGPRGSAQVHPRSARVPPICQGAPQELHFPTEEEQGEGGSHQARGRNRGGDQEDAGSAGLNRTEHRLRSGFCAHVRPSPRCPLLILLASFIHIKNPLIRASNDTMERFFPMSKGPESRHRES